jgi:hypothetical protein
VQTTAMTMVLQTWAQAHVEPSRAAVVMAMEPVWAAGFAVALGGERVTARMVLGGIAIIAAMYVVELAPRRPPAPGPGPAPGPDAVRSGASGPRGGRPGRSASSPSPDR